MHIAGLDKLGLLGIGSFGALPTAKTSLFQTQAIQTQQPTAGSCTPDGQFIWDALPDGTLYTRRLRAGEACQGTAGSNPTINQHNADGSTTVTEPDGTVHVIPPSTNQDNHVPGPITVIYDFDTSADASSSDPNAAHQLLQVGPFNIPLGARSVTLHWDGLLPQEWRDFISPELAHDCSNCVFTSLEDATPGHPMGTLRDFFGDTLPTQVNKDLVTIPGVYAGLTKGTPVPTLKISLPDQPIAVVSRPDRSDELWGMFMVVLPKDPSYPWDSTTNPYRLTFYWRKQPTGVWDWIKHIVGVIVNAVGDVISGLVDVACQVLPIANKIPNVYAQAGAVVLQLSGACTPSCPTGMTFNAAAKVCACPVGMTYDSVSKTCVAMASSTVPTWVWIGLAVVGAVVVFTYTTQKPASHKRLPHHPTPHALTP
jgi:hypothetical protein